MKIVSLAIQSGEQNQEIYYRLCLLMFKVDEGLQNRKGPSHHASPASYRKSSGIAMRSVKCSIGAASMVIAGTASDYELRPRTKSKRRGLSYMGIAECTIEIDRQRNSQTALSSRVHKPAMLSHRLPLHCYCCCCRLLTSQYTHFKYGRS